MFHNLQEAGPKLQVAIQHPPTIESFKEEKNMAPWKLGAE